MLSITPPLHVCRLSNLRQVLIIGNDLGDVSFDHVTQLALLKWSRMLGSNGQQSQQWENGCISLTEARKSEINKEGMLCTDSWIHSSKAGGSESNSGKPKSDSPATKSDSSCWGVSALRLPWPASQQIKRRSIPPCQPPSAFATKSDSSCWGVSALRLPWPASQQIKRRSIPPCQPPSAFTGDGCGWGAVRNVSPSPHSGEAYPTMQMGMKRTFFS